MAGFPLRRTVLGLTRGFKAEVRELGVGGQCGWLGLIIGSLCFCVNYGRWGSSSFLLSSGSLHDLPNLDPNKRRGPTFVADRCGARKVEVGRGPHGPEVRGGDVKERAEEHEQGGGTVGI